MELSLSVTSKKRRTYYKKNFKRMALIEYTKCQNAAEVFKKLGVHIESADRKYAAKLIHKWKKEFYDELTLISVSKCGFDEELINYELNFVNS